MAAATAYILTLGNKAIILARYCFCYGKATLEDLCGSGGLKLL